MESEGESLSFLPTSRFIHSDCWFEPPELMPGTTRGIFGGRFGIGGGLKGLVMVVSGETGCCSGFWSIVAAEDAVEKEWRLSERFMELHPKVPTLPYLGTYGWTLFR